MCNLNILIKNKDINETTSFLSSVSSLSYAYNPHSEGFYCNNGHKVVKSIDKVDLYEYSNELNKSKVILIHERLSTGGSGVENAHPFYNEEFVLIHNGVFSSFIDDRTKNMSDTAFFFEKFSNLFKKYEKEKKEELKGKNIEIEKCKNLRQNVIKKVIKELLDYNFESWSIALYDKIEGITYYFKNNSTKIYGFKNHDFLYLTTNDDNEKFLTLMKRVYKPLKIQNNAIYKIYINKKNNKIKMETIGTIKERSFGYINEKINYYTNSKDEILQSYDDFKRNGFNGYDFERNNYNYVREEDWDILDDDDLKGLNKIVKKKDNDEEYTDEDEEFMDKMLKKKLNIVKKSNFGYCSYCGKRTLQFSKTYGDYVCDDCLGECYDEFLYLNGFGVDEGYNKDKVKNLEDDEFGNYQDTYKEHKSYNDYDEYEKYLNYRGNEEFI